MQRIERDGLLGDVGHKHRLKRDIAREEGEQPSIQAFQSPTAVAEMTSLHDEEVVGPFVAGNFADEPHVSFCERRMQFADALTIAEASSPRVDDAVIGGELALIVGKIRSRKAPPEPDDGPAGHFQAFDQSCGVSRYSHGCWRDRFANARCADWR